MHMKKRIGFVLSGGGVRCIAHLGILQALDDFGIRPDMISGTSGGAIAGAFYAAGYSCADILKIIDEGHFFTFSNLLTPRQGLFSMLGFEEIYRQYFPHNSFEALSIPLHMAATDIVKGELSYFSTGNLTKSLLATSCIPFLFQPIAFQDTLYVDGGILNNFPIEPIQHSCDIMIGSHVNALQQDVQKISMHQIVDRSFHLALSSSVKSKAGACHLFIEPPNMTQFGVFDLKKTKEIFDYAYQYTCSLDSQIKALLE